MSKSLYKGIPFKEEEEANEHFSQFAVAAKPTQKDKLTRLFLTLFYIVFAGGYVVLFTVVVKIPYVIAILPFFLWMLWYFTWKRTQREYVYIVCRGTFYIYAVDGYGNAKEVYKAVVSSFEKVAPASFMATSQPDKKLLYCSSPSLSELYCALSSDNETTTAVYFDPSSKLLSSLRYYGGENVTVMMVSR